MNTKLLMQRLSLIGVTIILLYNFIFFNSKKSFNSQLSFNDTPKTTTMPCTMEHIDFYRYKGNYTFEKDVIGSNNFLYNELTLYVQQGDTNALTCRKNDGQVIVGRFSGSEPNIMQYSELPKDTNEPIPATFYTPGFYYFNEHTFEEKRAFAQSIGKLHCDDYAERNIFALFDWSYRPDQKVLMRKYAPNAAWIFAGVLYPPCFNLHDKQNVIPWTQTLQNKTILIVHPFVDTMKAQIPKLHDIWSNVNVIGAPHSCMPATMNNFKFVRTHLPVTNPTKPWYDALEEMKQDINNIGHFDIALLGCGGFGSPLLTHITQMAHKPSALYVGGALQLYFGIHGQRWYDINNKGYRHWHPLFTDAWTWPFDSDINFSTVGLIDNGDYVAKGQATGKV
jgi:hypothetical protein